MAELIRIEVEPSSGKDEIVEREMLLVRVCAPASRGAANKAAAGLLSRYFGKSVRIVSGGRKRKKIAAVG
jgi:uncharacterized protein (TIGR00251 family)